MEYNRLHFGVNPWPLFLVGVSAAAPQPSLRPQVTYRLAPPHQEARTLCPGDCPSGTDTFDALARVWRGIRGSTSSTQWHVGSPYTTGLYSP